MNRFFMGGALGLMAGAGLMLMPGAKKLRRTMLKETSKMKRMLQRM